MVCHYSIASAREESNRCDERGEKKMYFSVSEQTRQDDVSVSLCCSGTVGDGIARAVSCRTSLRHAIEDGTAWGPFPAFVSPGLLTSNANHDSAGARVIGDWRSGSEGDDRRAGRQIRLQFLAPGGRGVHVPEIGVIIV